MSSYSELDTPDYLNSRAEGLSPGNLLVVVCYRHFKDLKQYHGLRELVPSRSLQKPPKCTYKGHETCDPIPISFYYVAFCRMLHVHFDGSLLHSRKGCGVPVTSKPGEKPTGKRAGVGAPSGLETRYQCTKRRLVPIHVRATERFGPCKLFARQVDQSRIFETLELR